ncbi:MAG: ferrous iron transport protein A [Erysipelotrichaceae bacterium]|nr:ferrous iron transport protein A [Erysipelotrichaceae bacterium]
MKNLSELNEEEVAILQEINLPLKTRRRLEALGLVPGTTLSLLQKKATALVVLFRGCRFAMGKAIAKGILVKPL